MIPDFCNVTLQIIKCSFKKQLQLWVLHCHCQASKMVSGRHIKVQSLIFTVIQKHGKKQQTIHINPLKLSLDISVCCNQKKIASMHLQKLFWEAFEHQNCAVVLGIQSLMLGVVKPHQPATHFEEKHLGLKRLKEFWPEAWQNGRNVPQTFEIFVLQQISMHSLYKCLNLLLCK